LVIVSALGEWEAVKMRIVFVSDIKVKFISYLKANEQGPIAVAKKATGLTFQW
jgi:hypothetical protein